MVAVRAVVSQDDQFVADGLELLFEDQQVLGPGTEDADDGVAGLFESGRDGQQRRIADPAADTDDSAEVFDVGGLAERAGDVAERSADFDFGHLGGGLADTLENQPDGALFGVGPGDGQRDALAGVFINRNDDKLAGFAGPRDQRCRNIHQKYVFR